MMRSIRRRLTLNSQQRANSMAGLVAVFAFGFLALEAPPQRAGADVIRRKPVNKVRVTVTANRPTLPEMTVEGSEIAEDSTTAVASADPNVAALMQKVSRLKSGRDFLKQIPDYTACFTKQELVGGELLEEQDISMKIRHQPFSVYLNWRTGDRGREVIYVDGQNDGRMIVHAGGWKARLPALTIDPESSLAMGEARYPVTKAGVLGLVETMLNCHETDIAKSSVAACLRAEDQEFDGRPCETYVVEYKSAAVSPVYRKSITLIDAEWGIPVYIKNFGWPGAGEDIAGEELDEATLIEYYAFSEIEFRKDLANLDFDRGNEEYRFR